MKKLIIFVSALLIAAGMNAAPRSLEQAEREATQYFSAHRQAMHMPAANANAESMSHVWTARQNNGQPALYVFNRGGENGWVMISAEDRTYTVLAYSDAGHWDADNVPDGTLAWMETYSEQIEQAANLSTADIRTSAVATAAYTPVKPLCSTMWGQTAPYNNLCPIDADGERSLTGCPATAASQIMRKHKYPVKGIGSHSYEWNDTKNQSHTLTVDFSQTTYDWENMITDYKSLSSNEAQQQAVATLMYHCGVASEMDYGSESSGTKSYKMVGAMIEHFGYDRGIRTILKDYMPEDIILQEVNAELSAGRPVYISARTVKNDGHAFVCDGIDAEGLLSINWGWNGKSNGYYRLSAMNPSDQATSGNRGYTQNVRLYTHIQPNAGGKYYYSLTCNNIRVLNPACAREDKVQFRVDTLYNGGFTQWEGHLKLLIYKDGKLFDTRTINDSMDPLSGGYNRGLVSYNANFQSATSYPDGDYEVVVAARADDQDGVTFPINCRWLGEWRCMMKLTSDSVFVTVPTMEVPEYLDLPIPAEYTFTQMSAYYYPSLSSDTRHRWKVQLETEDFYSQEGNADADQMLLLFHIYSDSPNSVIGNHTSDKNNTYRCLSATQYYGLDADEESMTINDASEGDCAIVYNEGKNTYTIRYRLKINGTDYTGMAEIPMSGVKGYYGEDTDTYNANYPIVLDNKQTDGIDNITDRIKTNKVLHNGQVLILHGEDTYTPNGTRVK